MDVTEASNGSSDCDHEHILDPPPLPPRPRRQSHERQEPEQELVSMMDDGLKPDNTKEEPRKAVFYTDLERALVQFVLFHFPAVAVTLALLIIHALRISWDVGVNEGLVNNRLAALLFAAKVHESMIIASLFHILYANIRRRLVSSSGIPFGYLTAAFQLSSPFYILSSSFLAPLTWWRSASRSSVPLALLLVLSFILAALVGASSGVVMLPKLGWWEMQLRRTNPSMFSISDLPFSSFIVSPVENLYPMTIDLHGVPDSCIGQPNTASSAECPYGPYSDPNGIDWSWLANVARAGGDAAPSNLTSPGKSISWKSIYIPQDVVVATTPLDCVSSLLSLGSHSWGSYPARLTARASDQDGHPISLKQPQVAIQCTDPSHPVKETVPGRDNSTAPYSFLLVPAVYYHPGATFNVDHSILDTAYRSTSAFGFIDLGASSPVRASATYWTRYNKSGDALGLCFVDARWVESDAWVLPLTGDIPQYSFGIKNQTLNATQNAGDAIALDLPWLNMLNTSLDTAGSGDVTGSRFAYDRILDYGESEDIYRMLARTLVIYLADALSRVPNNHGWWFVGKSPTGPWEKSYETSTKVSDLASYAKVEVDYHHNVYEYNFEGTTAKLAWAVLLLHVLLVLCYFIASTCVYRSWSSSAWSQLGDLIVLAMNSARPGGGLLRNTGVGVSRWNTWRLTARVCEAADDGTRVELRLSDELPHGSSKRSNIIDATMPSAFQKYG